MKARLRRLIDSINKHRQVLFYSHTQQPVVALTIDDGPDAHTTPQLLDVLQAFDARATFFLISSRVPGNEPLLARMVEEKHEIGNHLTTNYPSVFLSETRFEESLLGAHQVLAPYQPMRWFRPGCGFYSQPMLATAKRHNYTCVLGDILPVDVLMLWPRFVANYILSAVRPGSIIVLHDYGKRGRNSILALHYLLSALNARGIRVVTVSELLAYTAA